MMLKFILSCSLVGLFSTLGYICLEDTNYSSESPKVNTSYLAPEINSSVKVYKVPIIKVNGETIGDQNATQIAYQKGVGFIRENGPSRIKN